MKIIERSYKVLINDALKEQCVTIENILCLLRIPWCNEHTSRSTYVDEEGATGRWVCQYIRDEYKFGADYTIYTGEREKLLKLLKAVGYEN